MKKWFGAMLAKRSHQIGEMKLLKTKVLLSLLQTERLT